MGKSIVWLVLLSFSLVILLLFLLSFPLSQCVACPSVIFFWPLCCLSFCPFLLTIMLLVLLSFSFASCIAC
jgi:hypothetical protein